MSRTNFHSIQILFVVLPLLACGSPTGSNNTGEGPERITARPVATSTSLAPGYYPLGVDATKDAVLFIPSSVSTSALPLMVMLHGAGGTPNQVEQMYSLGEKYGFAVLAPKSKSSTWDLGLGAFGQDVVNLNKALQLTFQKIKVDATRIALTGFSDGASYALSLGVPNGDLFTHVIAFSPGFMVDPGRRGKPGFFIAHGREDPVLPIENTQKRIVPYLTGLGYSVRYSEFEGGHTVNAAQADSAAMWFTGHS